MIQLSSYCPMFDGGLAINFPNNHKNFVVNHCCLRTNWTEITDNNSVWTNVDFQTSRKNHKNKGWDSACSACQIPESAGIPSYRTGMLQQFGYRDNLSGPIRLDLNFDISCNLACRTCGPNSSTFWQKHLKDNKINFNIPNSKSQVQKLITILQAIDLSNLEMVVLAGGESLLGTAYWQVVEYLTNVVPNAKTQLDISFQTNGTQNIDEKYYNIIDKCHLVKINFSLDGINEKFEYLRWPANWNQVVDNMLKLRSDLPVNVMFHIEQTVSIFNLYYLDELQAWMQRNFHSNRLGPNKQGEYGNSVGYGNHLAWGPYGISNITEEYASAIRKTKYANLITNNWQENGSEITSMINEIKKFDAIRNQDWRKTFPEVAEFYSRYI